jgi:cell division protein FtsL
VIQPATPTGPAPGTPSGTRKTATIVLSVLVAVLVAAAGLFIFLFLAERGAVADTNSEVSTVEQQITDQKGKLSDTKSAVDDLEQKGTDLQSTHDKLQACSDAAKNTVKAVRTGTDQELTDAIDKMLTDCVRSEGSGN